MMMDDRNCTRIAMLMPPAKGESREKEKEPCAFHQFWSHCCVMNAAFARLRAALNFAEFSVRNHEHGPIMFLIIH